MAKLTGAKCRQCRAEGEKLFFKGKRCETVRCAFERNQQPPGQHGAKRKRLTDYGIHLREKQKLKRTYGLTDRQFRQYFYKAQQMPGNTGENLLIMLETRLDNILFNCGWAASRFQSRQLIAHRHIAVNNKIVNISSSLVKAGNVITPSAHQRSQSMLKVWRDELKKEVVPSWVKISAEPPQIQIVQLPKREDITVPINEQLVVEFATR